VLATLPGEPHGLGLQMAALVLSARGLRVLSLGTEVPIAEIASLAARAEASAVGISVSPSNARNAASGLASLRSELSKKIELIVGGAGAPGVKGTTVFGDLRGLDAWAENLRRNSSRR
jgi:MerR family transcriptional regulator, light-induced transcriptional regulator